MRNWLIKILGGVTRAEHDSAARRFDVALSQLNQAYAKGYENGTNDTRRELALNGEIKNYVDSHNRGITLDQNTGNALARQSNAHGLKFWAGKSVESIDFGHFRARS